MGEVWRCDVHGSKCNDAISLVKHVLTETHACHSRFLWTPKCILLITKVIKRNITVAIDFLRAKEKEVQIF